MRALAAASTFAVTMLAVAPIMAQGPASQSGTASQGDQDGALRIQLPTLTVTAQKVPEDQQEVPVSVSTVSKDTLEAAGARLVSDAADYAPNTFFHEFTARKLSNPRFRGIGSSPSNPGVTTYIDGVPQLNANSSSLELTDVEQVEFVRGPQGALFGRNTVGGLVNVTSARPSLTDWHGGVSGPFGNFGAADIRLVASGPVSRDRAGLGIAVGYSGRDGFTKNSVTGHDLDARSALFGKVQMLWNAADNWEARLILSAERARDGDYALNDLAAARATPFSVSRDFEGHTHRDIVAPTVLLRRTGGAVDVSAVTGFVRWETDDLTDLDYTTLPLARRANNERDFQFTEEVRLASAKGSPLALSDSIGLKWQAGVSVFTQRYKQDAVNSYAPFVLSPLVDIPTSQLSPRAALDDNGLGLYGETTLTFVGRLDATVGVRGDFERKSAALDTSLTPLLFPATTVDAEQSFSDLSPQFTGAYRASPDQMLYATAARGFKSGGFNAASPPGSEAYGEEHSWNYEGGVKTLWFGRRLLVNGAVFYTRWRDMQVNVPNPYVPLQFFLANAAGASSRGGEVEFNARLAPGCDVFAGLGYTRARFAADSTVDGIAVGGNRLIDTPNYTANVGGQYSAAVTPRASVFVRADFVFRGGYYYDEVNTERQDAYSVANFRAGVRGRRLFAEAWTRNAFDTRYIPVAFPFPGAASGFIGENGAPRTFGVRAGVTF